MVTFDFIMITANRFSAEKLNKKISLVVMNDERRYWPHKLT